MTRPRSVRILVVVVVAILGMGILSAGMSLPADFGPRASNGLAGSLATGGVEGIAAGSPLTSGSPDGAARPSFAAPGATLGATPLSGPSATPAGAQTTTPTPTPTTTPTATRAPTARPTRAPTAAPTAPPATGWVTVVNDQFNSGGVPGHWSLYDGPYGSGAHNCAAPSHVVVSGGLLHMTLSYEATGTGSAGCGPGWYSGGLSLSGFSSVDQRVTVRFRVVRSGAAGHFIIPMRWPQIDASWPAAGEEDYCESSDLTGCDTYLHYSANNAQISASHAVDLSVWHTIRTERRNHVVRVYFDDLTSPVWTYAGTSSTLPDTLKDVLLQQECQSSCPSGTSGTEDIQIDWITVADPG
jgi:hypothetical protein